MKNLKRIIKACLCGTLIAGILFAILIGLGSLFFWVTYTFDLSEQQTKGLFIGGTVFILISVMAAGMIYESKWFK